MESIKKRYKKYTEKFDDLKEEALQVNFQTVYTAETGLQWKKNQAPCIWCNSGLHNIAGSDGALTYMRSNLAKCFACGNTFNVIQIIYHQHNLDYRNAIHYIASKYLHQELTNPYDENFDLSKYTPKQAIVAATTSDMEAEEKKKAEKLQFLIKKAKETKLSLAPKYLKSRGIDVEKLPKESFYESEKYKEAPESVVFLDEKNRCLNRRYIGTIVAGTPKSFTFGTLSNSVYSCCFQKKEKNIFVTEGVINALSVYMHGKSVISLFSSTNNLTDIEYWKNFFENRNVVFLFDNDANGAGYRSVMKIAKFVWKCEPISVSQIALPVGKDCNDLLQSEELSYFLENIYERCFLSQERIETELQKIKETSEQEKYIPALVPEMYENRKKTATETIGDFQFKEKKLTPEMITPFRGTELLTAETLKQLKIIAVEHYQYIDELGVHIFQATEEKPIFLKRYKTAAFLWRPQAQYPYLETSTWGEVSDSFVFGAAEKEDYRTEQNMTSTQEDAEEEEAPKKEVKLQDVCIAFNMKDFLNLWAIDMPAVLLEKENLSYRNYENIAYMVWNVYMVPERKNDATARKIGAEYLQLYTFHQQNIDGTEYESITEMLTNRAIKPTTLKKLIKNTSLRFQFWNYEKNMYSVDIVLLRYYLEERGYFTYPTPEQKLGLDIIKIQGKIVSKLEKEKFPDLVRYELDHFLTQKAEPRKLRNAIAKSPDINEKTLAGLTTKQLNFDNSGIEYQNFFFNDGYMWRVSERKIERQKQKNLERYVWKEELLPINSEITEPLFRIFYKPEYIMLLDEFKAAGEAEKVMIQAEIDNIKYPLDIEILNKNFYFLQFLWYTSFVYWEDAEAASFEFAPDTYWQGLENYLPIENIEEMKNHLINKLTAIGFFMKDFKEPSETYGWAILDALDPEESDKKKGAAGGGKSLITKALRLMKRVCIIPADAKNFTEYDFRYSVYAGERIMVLDDMHSNSKIGDILTELSDGINVNKKFKNPVQLNFQESPKMIVTRNYIDDEGERVDRRLLRSFVFNFFHSARSGRYAKSRTPKDFFGKNFFDFDTAEEKNTYANFFANCFQSFQKHNIVDAPQEQLRKFRQYKAIGQPLIEFLDTFLENNGYGYIERAILYRAFLADTKETLSPYQRQKQYSSAQVFKQLVEKYCEMRALVFNPQHLITDEKNRRIMKKSKTQTDKNGMHIPVEYFYMEIRENYEVFVGNPEKMKEADPDSAEPF